MKVYTVIDTLKENCIQNRHVLSVSSIRRRKRYVPTEYVNMREFFRLVGECEKE